MCEWFEDENQVKSFSVRGSPIERLGGNGDDGSVGTLHGALEHVGHHEGSETNACMSVNVVPQVPGLLSSSSA